MRTASPEQSAISAVTAFADLIGEGIWPDTRSAAHVMLHVSDTWTLAVLAGILVHRLGEPAREVLRDLGVRAAQNVSTL